MIAPATEENSPFAKPREFLDNRFVYLTISPRARGLSVGVNLNPDKLCNFDCVYCEVNRAIPPTERFLDVDVMARELESLLAGVASGALREQPEFSELPPNLLQLRHVALSGDGEPTLCPNFLDAVHSVFHLRALSRSPFFKVVLITNGSELHRPEVQEGISFFTRRDEVWVKLDAGTDDYLKKVNRTEVPLHQILGNIQMLAMKRPVIIQSLFASINGQEPPAAEIEAYAARLSELANRGALIDLVQIYSATRPVCNHACEHLSLRRLSQIAQHVRARTGLRVEIF